MLKGNVKVLGTHIKGALPSQMKEIALFSPTSSSLLTITEISKNKENLSEAHSIVLKEVLSEGDMNALEQANKFHGVILLAKRAPCCVDYITKFKAYSDIFRDVPKVRYLIFYFQPYFCYFGH